MQALGIIFCFCQRLALELWRRLAISCSRFKQRQSSKLSILCLAGWKVALCRRLFRYEHYFCDVTVFAVLVNRSDVRLAGVWKELCFVCHHFERTETSRQRSSLVALLCLEQYRDCQVCLIIPTPLSDRMLPRQFSNLLNEKKIDLLFCMFQVHVLRSGSAQAGNGICHVAALYCLDSSLPDGFRVWRLIQLSYSSFKKTH